MNAYVRTRATSLSAENYTGNPGKVCSHSLVFRSIGRDTKPVIVPMIIH